MKKSIGVVAGLLVVVAVAVGVALAASVKPYTVSRDGGWETVPLLSVGDIVKETSGHGLKYQMVGVPDGLGLDDTGAAASLFMNHELGQTTSRSL